MSEVATSPTLSGETVQTLCVRKAGVINAPPEMVWESLLEEMLTLTDDKGDSQRLKFEAWPGGRWYRDLGHNAGHLWAHVQVIKPNRLLELIGPMFMSYPVASHVQYRLTPQGTHGTRLEIVHRAFGLLEPQHANGVDKGWGRIFSEIEALSMRRVSKL